MTTNITKCLALIISLFILQACQSEAPKLQNEEEKANTSLTTQNSSPTENTVDNPAIVIDSGNPEINQAAAQIEENGFMQHLNILASDEFEGRAPATAGGKKTVDYLESQFKKLGLEPAFNGSYRQAVSLVELTITNQPALRLKHQDGQSKDLVYKRNSVVFTSQQNDSVTLEDSDLVFVGYGVVAPEYDWNDYAGIDMTGKTAVILVNDPGYRHADKELFKGRTMTYYGRWTYKYEEAARQGAAGAIVIHETGAAGYPWQVVSGSWSGPQYMLAGGATNSSLKMESWISQQAAQELFEKNGMVYADMVKQAGQQGFKPVALNTTASTHITMESRISDSHNVAGIIKGRSRPDEAFIYTAHWDHLGIKDVPEGEDAIFNGAQDNATGTAALLEVAQAFKALPQAPERSILFLSVTAEESGLLGSQAYAEQPAIPMAKTVAGINLDGMSTIGASNDVVVVGYGNSEMDDYLSEVLVSQERTIVPEPTPEKGFFYRSDHFNLAKKGVPMLYAEAGLSIRGKPAGYGAQQSDKYTYERYHKAADEVHAEWNNDGIMQDLNAHFRIGHKISHSDDWPKWAQGNEFKAIREQSLLNQ